MSWWVYLQDHSLPPTCNFGTGVPDSFGEVCSEPCYPSCRVEHHEEGGTYQLGGCPEAELNVTYNYSGFFYEALDHELGLKWLHGKTAKETLPRIRRAIAVLGACRDEDYWKSTPGNAGVALSILAGWAKQHPEGIWRIS